jgi:transcriptional regulator with XRE-family HTH domain
MDLTLEEVSTRLGITRERFSEYELGKRVPRPARAIAIAEFLGIPVNEFLQKRGQR